MRILTAGAASAFLFLTGCHIEMGPPGPTVTETRDIELDKAEIVRVQLSMKVGELKVQGGAKKLMEGRFEYNVPEWKPSVRYDASGFRGQLVVEQPSKNSRGGGDMKNLWDLHFHDATPLDLTMNFGVGEANVDCRQLQIRSLDLNMGVGEVKLDLRGKPTKDVRVNLRGGVGEATIYLPKTDQIGIVADAKGGVGGIEVRGLTKVEGRWVNQAFQKGAPVTMRIEAKGGVGAINLLADE
jgi:hypothetical protein